MAAWEKLSVETAKAYHYFAVYRDLGPARTLKKVSDSCGISANQYATRFGWKKRAEAYDAWVDEQTRTQRLDAILDMRDRHAHLAKRFQKIASIEFAAHEGQVMAAEAEIREARADGDPHTIREPILSLKQVLALAKAGVELERVCRGQDAEGGLVKSANEIDTSGLTVEELREFNRLLSKLQ